MSTLPQDTSHAKKPNVGGNIGFQIDQEGKAKGGVVQQVVHESNTIASFLRVFHQQVIFLTGSDFYGEEDGGIFLLNDQLS